MRCIFAAGGTGGHIQPALALAEELKKADAAAEILFLGGRRPQEREWVTRAGFDFRPVHSSPLAGGIMWKVSASLTMSAGTLESLGVMRRFNPDVVLGFGGYPSFPPLLAGSLLKKPKILFEQNVLPGRTNRLLSRMVAQVHSQWIESQPHLWREASFFHSGNPVRRDIIDGTAGVNGDRNALLVMGGSQGSQTINQLMIDAAPLIARRDPDLEIIHLAGQEDGQRVRQAYESAGLAAEVHDYLDDIVSAYCRSSLAICRAGGTTIAELMVAGIPAILIPYPFAAEDHQTRNALIVEENGAGLCLPQKEASPLQLAELVADLYGHPKTMKIFQKQTQSLAMPEASECILQHIWKLLDKKGTH